jgi:soluble lytic murein transglycosylase-like protein
MRALPFKDRADNYQPLIEATARAEGIQAELLHAVIAAESAYDPRARSPKGALGLMQLMPGTAAQYGITNPRDPAQNLAAGARHLRYLLGEFDNDMKLALAAYNAGEQAVRKYSNRIPPYPETQAYVQRVLAYYHQHLSFLILGEL